MPISLTCPACGKRLKAKETLAGRPAPCPGCGHKLLIPPPEEEAAVYLLQPDTPPKAPPPPPRPAPASEDDAPAADRAAPRPRPAKPRTRAVASLPPLTSNEPPLWLRHLHWLLVLALLPLALSLLHRGDDPEDFLHRLQQTVERASPDRQPRIVSVLRDIDDGKASFDDLFAALPDQKLAGALLPRKSWMHWAFAGIAAVVFMAFFLLLALHKTAEPLHLLGIGLFTATAGILFLLLVQALANWSQGVWVTSRSILVLVLFYAVKLIGFSYRAALEPDNGFFLSFMGFTLGVGFCEEVCKALPLLVYYRGQPKQGWRGAFLWGLASGAGFGISEGIMYAGSFYNGISGPGIYVVRFISCVALHALWTGSVAITLNQKQGLIQEDLPWYEYIPRLYLIVGIPMVLHGLYDTLLKKELSAAALVVAVLSFLFLAFQISRLHGEDDEEARQALLREYKRRRAALS